MNSSVLQVRTHPIISLLFALWRYAKKNCLLSSCSRFHWKIMQWKGKGVQKECRENRKQGFPSVESHPISASARDMHFSSSMRADVLYSSTCYDPNTPEPLLNALLSSRCPTATFNSAVTRVGAKANWVIYRGVTLWLVNLFFLCSPTCSHPALVGCISRHGFCSTVCLHVFECSHFCSATHQLSRVKRHRRGLAGEGAGGIHSVPWS